MQARVTLRQTLNTNLAKIGYNERKKNLFLYIKIKNLYNYTYRLTYLLDMLALLLL